MGLTKWLLVLAVPLLVLYVLTRSSKRIRYTVKYTAYLLLVCFIAFCTVIYSIFRLRRSPENFACVTRMTKFLRVPELMGIEYFIEGEEILEGSESPRIYVSNHQSSLDMMGMYLVWPKRTTIMAKSLLKYVPVFGLGAWLCQTVFIDRVSKDKAKRVLEKTIKQIKDDKLSLWVYPEGTRNREGGMLPFKKGAFRLAVDAQIPIVPIVFSPYTFYDKNTKRFDCGSVKITVMEPISTERMTLEHMDELMTSVREQMLEVYNRGFTPSDRRSCKRIK